MAELDDYPQRSPTHDTAFAAESAFEDAVREEGLFIVQGKDRHDYGTDVQIEARLGADITNVRVHVQLKGTDATATNDGSIGVRVARTNLNYLLVQPDSLYVCFHVPSRRLLVRYAQDVHAEYERKGDNGRDVGDLTIRFRTPFDSAFQRSLSERVVSSRRSARSHRVAWSTIPKGEVGTLVHRALPEVYVPSEASQARAILEGLYEEGRDDLVRANFAAFDAVLGGHPGWMDVAYMSEINLAMNGGEFDEARVRAAIDVLGSAIERGESEPGSLMYCQANAFLALREYERARDLYAAALARLDGPVFRDLSAMCYKNLGAAVAGLGNHHTARLLYQRALELNPDLAEAHMALSTWYRVQTNEYGLALSHLDSILVRSESAIEAASVQGWRVELLFLLNRQEDAFGEMWRLLSHAKTHDWVLLSCARQVARWGTSCAASASNAMRFWREYLRLRPRDPAAKRELFWCLSALRSYQVDSGWSFAGFRLLADEIVGRGDDQAALIWDRVGHWAQDDGDWEHAEEAFRRAWVLDREGYAYCLGTALNFLDRHEEALRVLGDALTASPDDGMAWFQVAFARERLGDIGGAVSGYELAIVLEPGYELAWFNLGGVLWNSRRTSEAVAVWKEALARFPDHMEAERLRRELPIFKLPTNP